eukprot:TRINITY_DN6941_c0_g1_i7.p1 TRINITY_DN6941_c0_g1~~TRINITY_DN6941_c0_g1_i7.p1  ORF type:complete len:403 (+),score=62.85 TRINITY_DN6941_c0_g1_i7:99-1307(+)
MPPPTSILHNKATDMDTVGSPRSQTLKTTFEKRTDSTEAHSYEAADVLERSALSFRTSRRLFDNVKRRKELSTCGFGSNKQYPYKTFGALELDPSKLDHNKLFGNEQDPLEITEATVTQPTHVEPEVVQAPQSKSVDYVPDVPSGYGHIRNRLHLAHERLKSVKAGTTLLETIPDANFIQALKTIGQESIPARHEAPELTPKVGDTFLTAVTNALNAMQTSSPGTSPSVARNAVPTLPLKGIDSPTTKASPRSKELPLISPGGFHTTNHGEQSPARSTAGIESPRKSRSISKSAPVSARHVPTDRHITSETSKSQDASSPFKNTPLDSEFSISQTRNEFYQTKQQLAHRLEGDIERHDTELLITARSKFAVLDSGVKCATVDLNSELQTMRLRVCSFHLYFL